MTTSGVFRDPILMLAEVMPHAALALDLIITLLVVVLRIENVMSYPTFSLMPTNRPIYFVELLGKML